MWTVGVNLIGSSCCQRLFAMFLVDGWFLPEIAKTPRTLNPELEVAMLGLKTVFVYFKEISFCRLRLVLNWKDLEGVGIIPRELYFKIWFETKLLFVGIEAWEAKIWVVINIFLN